MGGHQPNTPYSIFLSKHIFQSFKWKSYQKPLCLVNLALTLLLFSSFSEATEFVVGGNNYSWGLPSSPDEFNNWAKKIRLEIGDTILLKYDAKTDSVLQVTEKDYRYCNKSSPIKSYDDGNTKIILYRSGPFFFISGTDDHCEKGEKLEIKVLSLKHRYFPTAPMPSPSENHRYYSPAPAPTNGGSLQEVGYAGRAVVVGIILALF